MCPLFPILDTDRWFLCSTSNRIATSLSLGRFFMGFGVSFRTACISYNIESSKIGLIHAGYRPDFIWKMVNLMSGNEK